MSISLVQKASGTAGTAVFTSANTDSNLLLCAVRGGSSCAVSDPSNGLWTKAKAVAAGSNGVQIWYVLSCLAAGPLTVTASNGQEPVITEWGAQNVTFSALTNGASSSSTSLSSGSISPTAALSLVIAASSNEGVNGSGLTWGGGFVDVGVNGNGNTFMGTQQGGAASYTATATVGGAAIPNAIAIAAFTITPAAGLSTTLKAVPISATITNSSGYSWPVTSPTLGAKLGQPTPICFCDANGNELTVTGSTKGAFVKGAIPVVLCDPTGHPLAAPFVFTSNGNAITVSATPTGVKMGQPTPVVATDPNGFIYSLSGFTLGAMAANPTPICLTDVNGNVLSLSGVTP